MNRLNEAQDALSNAIISFFDTHPLYYCMLASLVRVPMSANQIPTIAVGFKLDKPNLLCLFYNPEFIAEKTPLEMRFILNHECQHLGLMHIRRGLEYNSKLYNIAADVVVNSNIPEANKLKKLGLWNYIDQDSIEALKDLNVREMTVEEIYWKLKPNHDEFLKRLQQMMDNGQIKMVDSHDMWNQGPNQDQQPSNSVPQGMSPEQQAALDSFMKDAVQKLNGRDPGAVPGSMRRAVEEILKSKTDWRKILSIFAQTVANDDRESSWKRYNRRLGVVSPGRRKELRPKILGVVDNSGSIYGPIYDTFIAQLLKISEICRELDVIGVDTAVNCEAKLKDGKLPDDFDLNSGGGTDFQPAFDYAKNKKYDAIIYLTDGQASHSINTYGIPVLFAISPDGIDVEGYRNIKITED